MTKTKNLGFTLSEVLITLVIIGIISAMVIPVIHSYFEEQKNIAAWKRAYSNIAAATQLVTMESGTMENLCPSWDDNCLMEKYSTKLNFMKKCLEAENLGNCWHNNDNSATMYDGEGINWWTTCSGLILSDGSFVNFNFRDATCSESKGSYETCGYILIDVNGFKKPNSVGKDIFQIYLLKNSIKPRGSLDDADANSCHKNGSGWSCAQEYLKK